MYVSEVVEDLKIRLAVLENEIKSIRKMEWIVLTAVIGQMVVQVIH